MILNGLQVKSLSQKVDFWVSDEDPEGTDLLLEPIEIKAVTIAILNTNYQRSTDSLYKIVKRHHIFYMTNM